MNNDTETARQVREVVEAWANGQGSPRRAMHFLDSLVAILATPQPPAASQPDDLQRQRVLANALAAVKGKK